jgi:hypothetical protein
MVNGTLSRAHPVAGLGCGRRTAIVDVPSREKALEVAKKFMELHRVHWPSFEGESECRPLEEY